VKKLRKTTKNRSQDSLSPARDFRTGNLKMKGTLSPEDNSIQSHAVRTCFLIRSGVRKVTKMETQLHSGTLSKVRSPPRGPEMEGTRSAAQQFGCTPTLFWRASVRAGSLARQQRPSLWLWTAPCFGCQNVMNPFIRSQSMNISGVYNMRNADSGLLLCNWTVQARQLQ
jgi:hypothetical protein